LPVDVPHGTVIESQLGGKLGELSRFRVAEIHPDQRALLSTVFGDVSQRKVLRLKRAV
jgi:hypothetical protein